MDQELKTLYEKVSGDFYKEQTESKNPLRKWFHLNRYRIAASLVKSKTKKGTKVLDLGCGSCDWNRSGLDVFGADLNKNLMEEAVSKGRLSGYKICPAEQTGLPDESYDIITTFEFLEHMTNYEEIIKEGKRLLKPGGHFIVSVPYDVNLSFWKPLFFLQVLFQGYILQNDYYKKECGHVNHFSMDAIKGAFVKQGYLINLAFDMRKFTIFMVAQKPPFVNKQQSETYDDLTVILPTLNEEKGLSNLLPYLLDTYKGMKIIVSDDGSKDRTRETALKHNDGRITFLDRSAAPVHGLTASVVEAVERVKTRYFVVMDADEQHPPEKIGEFANLLRLGDPVVVASRVEVDEGWGFARKLLSYVGTGIGKISFLLRGKNYLSFDILGGYFGCRTRFWRKIRPNFRPKGYKVLFDFLKAAPARLKIEEIYYRFETRKSGVTKINWKIYSEYLRSCFTR
ncbi:MAG: hypothetical protein A3A86_02560 [Elusimicrobia bacterium RIFCSPLOWO2_01_FULL_60_11]|nr:MAG: hypothetical protein A3A86_02560 [Elusimicrobia bacterium RIFCSPLOWO2_01_FULL_60_11]